MQKDNDPVRDAVEAVDKIRRFIKTVSIIRPYVDQITPLLDTVDKALQSQAAQEGDLGEILPFAREIANHHANTFVSVDRDISNTAYSYKHVIETLITHATRNAERVEVFETAEDAAREMAIRTGSVTEGVKALVEYPDILRYVAEKFPHGIRIVSTAQKEGE